MIPPSTDDPGDAENLPSTDEFGDAEIPGSTDDAGEAEAPLADPEAAPRALRRYFAQHNRQAVLLAFFALIASALLWAIAYLFVYWFCLVGVTLSHSFNPDTLLQVTEPHLLGAYFPWWFALGAFVTLVIAAVVRRTVRVTKLREARLYLVWVVVELFMAIPNVTFSIWGNLSAITRLRRQEAAQAWRLLQRIEQEGGRLNMTSLRQEIDNEKTLQRVVFGLQLVGLITLRESNHGWFLHIQNREAFASLLAHSAPVA